MESKRKRFFLLLEDDTVGSVICASPQPPDRYRGKSVIFATPRLKDIGMLRMMLRSTTIGG
jgi:hypothetical protein